MDRLRALPSQRSRRSVSPVMVKELTNSNWCENVDGAKELSVVFFYANWCRNCKAVMPAFKRLEREFGSADFYKVRRQRDREIGTPCIGVWAVRDPASRNRVACES